MARRRRSLATLIVLFALVAGAGAYFMGVNPIWRHINQGLDLKGGLNVVYQAVSTPGAPVTQQAMERTVEVMRYRVDKLGVAEPYIQQEGADRIVVELPGVRNADSAIQIIGKTALLEFRDSQGHVIVTGSHLQSAQAQIDPTQGNVVALQFDAAGARAIADFTSRNVGKNKMIENPVIQSAITGGQGIITGFATLKDAQNMAIELNSGALPLKLDMIENQSISPTLGADSIRRSLEAAVVAAALVVAFMLTIYRIPGFWADLALAVYAMLLLAALYGIHATLTLAGITGIILSIGMAVDANVIIYERIKEELRGGRTLRSAVDAGFRNGLRAVVDSNATTIIACAVLYWLGSGPVRGFAVTLALGVVISLFTAVVFTQYMLPRLVAVGVRASRWFFAPQGVPAAAAPAAAAVAGGGPLARPRPETTARRGNA
jgi:preprotein translocase subunit SecD